MTNPLPLADSAKSTNLELVTMSVGGAHFGIPVMRVRDVLDTPLLYPVPLAPRAIFGSINLRGRIVTAIDLRARLDMTLRAPTERCMCVIVEKDRDSAGEPYALLVDEIGEVMEAASTTFEANPATLSKTWALACAGLYRTKEHLLLLLDIDVILDIEPNAAAA